MLVGLAAVVGGVPATHAAAADSLLVCTGTTATMYDPPLTNTPTTTTVTFHTDLSSCTVALNGTIESGTGDGQFVQEGMSCNTFALPPDNVQVYEWDPGESSSEVTWTDNTVTRGLATTVAAWHGSVTGGLHQGAEAISTTIIAKVDIDACLTTGVSQLEGPNTLQLVDPLP